MLGDETAGNPHRTQYGTTRFTFPEPEDHLAIQRSLGEVLRLLANRELEGHQASAILRTLSIASSNLARIQRHEARQQARRPADPTASPTAVSVQTVVLDPVLGPLAPAPLGSGTCRESAPKHPTSQAIEIDPAHLLAAHAFPYPAEAHPAEAPLLATPPGPVCEIRPSPETLPDPIAVAIATYNLPSGTDSLFEYAKREIDAFNLETSRLREAGEPSQDVPLILTNGLPINPIELYLYALAKLDAQLDATFDAQLNAQTPNATPLAIAQPLPVQTYPSANEDFRTFQKFTAADPLTGPDSFLRAHL